MIPFWIKIAISLVWDFLDFTVFRLPVFGTFFDVVGTMVAILLWGNMGVLALWEIIDITDQLDAQVPTLTAIGVLSYMRGNKS